MIAKVRELLADSFEFTTERTKLWEALDTACKRSSHWVPLPIDPNAKIQGLDYFLARYIGFRFPGRGLDIMVSVFEDDPRRACLSAFAERWGKDKLHPSVQEYDYTLDLAAPLLRCARKLLGNRMKLLQRPKDNVRSLRGSLERSLRYVIEVYRPTICSRQQVKAIDLRDQDRFRRFIRLAHKHQSVLRPSDVGFHLTAAGFHPELVSDLQRQYKIGRQVLALCDEPWELRRDRRENRPN